MSYLNYLTEVLGVSQILRPVSAAQNIEAESLLARSVRLSVFDLPVSAPLVRSPLFKKMIEAMGIGLDDVRIYEYESSELESLVNDLELAGSVLSFAPELTQVLQTRAVRIANLVTTYGPRELEKNPQLKRQTWNDLQKLMKIIEEKGTGRKT